MLPPLLLLISASTAAWSSAGLPRARSGVAFRLAHPLASGTMLSDAARAATARTLPSGLVYDEIVRGEGKQPTLDSIVKVDYTGTLEDGSVFDSSVARGVPAEFQLNQVIKGWQEGVALMKPGGKAILTIPAALAYGSSSRPGIPANSDLQFEVELLGVSTPERLPEDYLGRSFGSASMGKAPANAPPKDRTGQMIGMGACALVGFLAYAGIIV